MSFWIGRLLQMMAMIILPFGLLIGLVKNNIQLEVRLLGVGGVMFILGWLLAREKK